MSALVFQGVSMRFCSKLIIVSMLLPVIGCTNMLGVTGANGGRIVNEKWMEYDVTHPGLKITIIEPYSTELLPISTVGKSTPSPLKHIVSFGTKANLHKFEVIGKYQKKLYLDSQFYGSIWSGNIVIKDGILIIDDVPVSPKKN
jgi:hypothetical protein